MRNKKQFFWQNKVTFMVALFMSFFLLKGTYLEAQTTKRIYLVGNSVTDAVNYSGLKSLAESQGNNHTWARHMIPGAPLDWLWSHMADGFTESPYGAPDNAFPNYTWDAVTLQPFDRQITGTSGDLAMAGNYINLAKGNSPNVQFYIYERWPRTPDGKAPTDPSITATTWNDLWERTYTGGWDGTNETRDFFVQLTQQCRSTYTDVSPACIIPVGSVFYEMNKKMDAGQVPGYNEIWQVYSDGIHTNNIGSYIVGCTFYSTIYQADPRGTAVPSEYGSIGSTLASIIQETIWQVVTGDPLTGVSGGSDISVTGVSVSPLNISLAAGSTAQLSATVSPSNASNKNVTWSSNNTAVASVNASGLVTATGSGNATITVTTADGGYTATSQITVTSSGGGGSTTGVMASWDFAGEGGSSSSSADASASGVQSATAQLGTGLNAINYLSDGLTASGHNSVTLADALANNEYISFTVQPSAGNSLGVTSIEMRPVSQNRSRSFTLFSSINGFTAGNELGSFTAHYNSGAPVQTINIGNHSATTNSIEYRLYIYGSNPNQYEAVGLGNGTGNDLVVNGSISGGDSQAPTAPANLSASNIRQTTVDLAWEPAIDNVGVTGYDIFNGSTKLNSSNITATNYQLTGLTEGQGYTITVKAKDGAGNVSASSNAVSITTNNRPQASISASPLSGNAPLDVSFSAAGSSDPDNGDFILGYDWDFGDGSPKSNENAPVHTYNSAGNYTVTLRVADNREAYSNPVTTTITVTSGSGGGSTVVYQAEDYTSQNGTTVANNHTGFQGTGFVDFGSAGSYIEWNNVQGTGSQASISFRYAHGGTDTRACDLIINGSNVASMNFTPTGGWTSWASIQIDANLNSGNNTIRLTQTTTGGPNLDLMEVTTTSAGDTEAPTVPTGLTSGNVTQTSVDLSWNASTDNVGVTGYDIMSGSSVVKSVGSVTSTTVTGLSAGTQYSYAVRAKDEAGNVSSNSSTTSFTTQQASQLRNPENPANTVSGLHYQYYEGSWDLLPDFSGLSAVKEGDVANIDLSVRNVNDYFGFSYTGYVDVPSDGDYTFYTTSDDGSKLYIGTTEVVNNDGLHGSQERSGTIGLKAGKHALRVDFFEKTGGELLEVRYSGPGITKTLIPSSAFYRDSESTIITGNIIREYWTGVSGTSVSDIPLGTAPSGTSTLTSLEGPVNWADSYGTRIRGYLVPTVSGSYALRISGDDNSELWISTNNDPANKTRIAYVSGWTNSREWSKYPEQTASARTLNAGQAYYIEVLHKEGGGGDHVAVGWTGPGISTITVISGANLAPYEGSGTGGDTESPSVPSGLSVSSFTQYSVNLSWTASTDNVGVTGYDVFVNGSFNKSVTGVSASVDGLACGTSYTFAVRAKDAANNISSLSSNVSGNTSSCNPVGTPQVPIGMNLPSLNYYEKSIRFTNVMTTASEMFTFYDGGPWNSEQIQNIPRDANGYPTQVPYNVGGQSQKVRFLINNYYNGRYYFVYDGEGSINIGGAPNGTENGYRYIDLNGQGGHVWVDITFSTNGNHIRNMKILPPEYADGSAYPTFRTDFKEGLMPFHAIRFMDWTHTNNSKQDTWSSRVTKDYYTQGGGKGSAIEYAIELCNELDQDAWFCVPHRATDDYITNMARMIRDNLEPGLKLYIEYSNEIWNWQFDQAGWVVNNCPGHLNSYVTSDLAAISAAGSNHPEKDAYMMARTFRLFDAEFTGANADRLIRVAAVQHSWYDNTRRVLEFLFNVDGNGADMVSPAGYFNFEGEHHNNWEARCTGGETISPEEIIDSVLAIYDETSGHWTQKNAEYANQYGVGYAVYEGGQHMQPYMQGNWCYNQSVWDAQIHPKMYDLYMKNFEKHAEPVVNCQIFMAFSYLGARESVYGSWGHLEDLSQIGATDYMTIAPKYQALLDANTPKLKSTDATTNFAGQNDVLRGDFGSAITIYPNPAEDKVSVESVEIEITSVQIFDIQGKIVYSERVDKMKTNINLSGMESGIYLLYVMHENGTSTQLKLMKR